MASEVDQPPWRVDRYVGINTQDGLHWFVKGNGHLRIRHGHLRCELTPRTARLAGFADVRHAYAVVKIYRPRLLPLVGGTRLRVDDGDRVVFACLWGWGIKRLIREIGDAGFQLELHRTWIYGGYRYFGRSRS
jgi:hypothetical protein